MRRGFDGADVPHRNVTAHPEIAVGTFAALLADAARRRISLSRHLLQYVTGRAKASIIMKLRRFTKRLRYRCGRCFANFNRSHPTRRCGLFHGDAASSRVTTTWRDAAITTWQARHFHTRKFGPSFLVPSRSDGTPCQAIRSLQGPPYRGSVARGLAAASQFALRAHPTRRLRRGRIPRRTFTILARNQIIGSMRE